MHFITSKIIHYPLNRQPWYNPGVRLAAFWAKQEINYLEDLSEPLRVDAIPAQFQNLTPDEAKKAIQIAASMKVRYLKIVVMQS